MLRVSLIRLYLRIRSLAVLEVRDGDALTYGKKNAHPSLWRSFLRNEGSSWAPRSRRLSSVNADTSHLPSTADGKPPELAVNLTCPRVAW